MKELHAINTADATLTHIGSPILEDIEDIRRLMITMDYVGTDDTDAEDVLLIQLHSDEAATLEPLIKATASNDAEGVESAEKMWGYIETYLPGREVGLAYSRRCPEGLMLAIMQLMK